MYRGRIRFELPMMWTMAFMLTFVVGGMTGVLLAIPPADYQMHNSTFLVAHFHNMLVTGALFGFFAGYMYWFPKAFGFTLDEKWGVRAFWCWLVGFYLAFMPLYALGFMGMPRRIERYSIPEWQPWLVVAALGACVIALGVVCLLVQLWVSIRRRESARDLSGDPWNARTLEWLTSSPPAPYNFAVLPEVRDLDAFLDMKQRGIAYRRPERYVDIHMPKNTAAGVVLGAFAFLLGFAVIWHIWWLAIASFLAAWGVVMARSFNGHTEYLLAASEVQKLEEARYRKLEKAAPGDTAPAPSPSHQPVAELV